MIESDNFVRTGSSHGNAHAVHAFTLTNRSGGKIILNDMLKTIGVIGHIKLAVFALLEPPLTERYDSGEMLEFASVTIHKKNGLAVDGQLHA